jgi:hypothetical protein
MRTSLHVSTRTICGNSGYREWISSRQVFEGYEAALIAGARTTLKRYRPVLLLELDAKHLARVGRDELWAELISLGYQPHNLIEGEPSPAQTNEPATHAPATHAIAMAI